MVFYNPVVSQEYTLLLIQDSSDGTYTVTVPYLPGVVTQGATLEEAIANGREAIGVHLEGLASDGEPIPAEGIRPQAVTVSVGRAHPSTRIRRNPRISASLA